METERIHTVTQMSKVEADNIKAKTRAINHANVMNWIRLSVSTILGVILIIVGFTNFLKSPNNNGFLYLTLIGVFLVSTIKPTIDAILQKVNP